MKILIADDDIIWRRVLENSVRKWGYDAILAKDGVEAWDLLQQPDSPKLALLDWMMPGMDGVEVCQRLRATLDHQDTYLILLTAKGTKEDIVAGFQYGADDYVTKPFDPEELKARIKVGVRIVQLQAELAQRVRELEEALANVRQLEEFLPICSYCKKVRNDQNYWEQVENYLTEHTGTKFSHSICPECREKIVKPEIERYRQEQVDKKKQS